MRFSLLSLFFSSLRLRLFYYIAIKFTAKFTPWINKSCENRNVAFLNFKVVPLSLISEKWPNIKIWTKNLFRKNWQGVMLWFWKKVNTTLRKQKVFFPVNKVASRYMIVFGKKGLFQTLQQVLHWINTLHKNHICEAMPCRNSTQFFVCVKFN